MYDTLIIVGNGFDIWQGLHTSYSQFQKYYLKHREEILEQLHLKKYKVKGPNGETMLLSDVELVYGDPFKPEELQNDFWYTFEASLDVVDAERLNMFFGKTNQQLYHLQCSVENAQVILRKAFSEWIQTIHIKDVPSGYLFDEHCYCINFNYTDTLAKRFGNPKECHIHGSQEDGEDIVFGHATHPQRPVEELVQFEGRFLGLYLIETMLHETDKHVHENIQFMRVDLAEAGVQLDHIKDIYVLGHSFGPADFEYFQYFVQKTSVNGAQNKISNITAPPNTLDELYLRIQYAIHKYGEHSPVSTEESEAVAKQLAFERSFDEQDILSDFYSHLPELKRVGKCDSDAKWHISYYNDSDRQRIENVMDQLGCTNYELFKTIDECIERFKC